MFTRIFLFFICSLTLSTSKADVWKSSAAWDDAYEARYSQWVRHSFQESFFTTGDWAGIKTDCADAIFAARIVFSYLNGLPFALGKAEPSFSNSSTFFDRVEGPILRVRLFIEHVNEKTWTGTLAKFTYPIAVNRQSVVPGVIWLKPGHVEMVSNIRENGVVELRGSWLPGAVRDMITVTTLGYVPTGADAGFRRWIWPQNIGMPKETQPGYDESQVQPATARQPTALDKYLDISKFEESVRSKLAVSSKSENAKSRLKRLAHDFCALIEARSQVVTLGYDYVGKVHRCLNDREYYAYSTPGRDSNLRRVVFGLGLQVDNDLGRVAAALNTCKPIVATDGSVVRPMDFLKKLLTLDFSSDPHQKPSARFGLEPPVRVCVDPDGLESDSGN